MRIAIVVLGVVVLGGSVAAAGRGRPVRCCMTVDVPGTTAGPQCVPVTLVVRPPRLAARPRRVCRLVGGRAPREGRCACA